MSEEWSPAQKDRAFEEFWRKYPRRVGKFIAHQKWGRLVNSPKTFEAILAAIERNKRTEQWHDIRFIPHASTFLNQRRWEDWVDPELVETHKNGWICDHEPHCGNRETCAVVASRVCPHKPKCSKRTECLERIVNQWV